jgi:hypothetical protein
LQQKEEALLKDCFEDLVKLFKRSASLAFLNEPLKKWITKSSNIWHFNLFTELMNQNATGLKELIATVTPHFKQFLLNENYKTHINSAQILSLVGFFCTASTYTGDASYLQALLSHEGIMQYLTTSRGFVNTLPFLQKGPSYHDVKYHLKAIELLTIHHY